MKRADKSAYISLMRTDEQIEAALRDPDDLRPLLLGASRSELAPLHDALELGPAANPHELAEAIDDLIAAELGNGDQAGRQVRLSAWAARHLGSPAEPMDLATADQEIARRTRKSAGFELETPTGGKAALLVIAITLARLRTKKLRRLQAWQPLLNLLVRETEPRDRAPDPQVLPPEVEYEPIDRAAVRQSRPGGGDEAVWETIRKAGGEMPLAIWEEKLTQARKEVGRFNIIVAGRTGVGKTTLIGAVFGKDIGNTLMGRPRTRGRIWYPETPEEGDILRLCDTEGLEMERYEQTLSGLKQEIERANASSDPLDHIHVAWLCIDEPSLTVQPGEEALARLLASENIPLIVVLTKAGMAPAFRDEVAKLLPDARAVIRVRAAAIEIEGRFFAPMGLSELMDATQDAIPDAIETAWLVASRNLEANSQRCETLIRRAAAAAAAAGATPIPMVDAAGVFGIQVGMIITVSLNMGVKLRRADMRAMAMTLIGALGLTAGGRFIAGQIAKLIPGVGTIAGAALTGSAAAALTYGLGRAYLQYLRGFYAKNDRMPEADELVVGFRTYWREWKNKYEPPPDAANS
jgi:uncharacterized protein (DUF697 family)/GTP-binding protein EngB required for normal cell division